MRQSIAGVEVIARANGVRLVCTIDPALPHVDADPDRAVQALVNLLSNAIKFAPSGTDVTIAARADGAGVAVAVVDRGKGIAPDQIGLLFRKFQQLDSSDTRRVPGTGLGLAITKALVEQHGGTIAVESTPGSGTTFAVVLPVAKSVQGTATAQ